MEWKVKSDRPIYTQVIEYIQKQIVSGELSSGDRLLSVRELAGILQVNPNTVQRAYAELERIGLLDTIRNTGREVTMNSDTIKITKENLARNYITDFISNMNTMGFSLDEIIESLKKIGGEANV